ncbi:MAG: ABC transporter permease [Endomicrobium sp.]|jgi:ABC-2 type transport system permease protein|nr:ABC transporter permease [Endomicrobium sp.]
MISKTNIKAVAYKEYRHIARDPFTLIVALVFPLILVLFFGFIIDLDYKHIVIDVQDNDKSQISRHFTEIFTSSEYFDVKQLQFQSEAECKLVKNDTPAIMIIKEDFGKNIVRGQPGKIQFLLDGSDNAKTGILIGYLTAATAAGNKIFAKDLGFDQNNTYEIIRTRFLFNTELNSRWFVVPGLSTIIIGLIAIILTSLTIAKEWENGSMELLLSTSVRPIEIVMGKIIPYFVLNFFNILIVFIVALIVFKIPFEGNFLLYIAACIIYVTGTLALGILISVVTRQQQAAVQIAFAIGLLPSFMFSGFIFSIENMPLFFRYFTAVFPQRWFMLISRSLFLSRAGFNSLFLPFLIITAFSVIMIILASKKFKTDLEP